MNDEESEGRNNGDMNGAVISFHRFLAGEVKRRAYEIIWVKM